MKLSKLLLYFEETFFGIIPGSITEGISMEKN